MTPLSSPDTLRKTLKLLKRFYSGYTDRYMGYTDLDGYKYNGTVENFGSEVYLESRKLLMERPPIELVFPGNTFSFYFDIAYSELIGTYEQQNMFVATLKDNVLRSNCIYKIIFRDCVKKYVLRSESWSDPSVYHDTFIMTQTNPVLQIQTPNGDGYDTEEIDLVVSNNETYNIIYSFHMNKTNYDSDRPDSDLVESWDEENGVLTLRALTYRDVNIPMIWIYSDAFNVLPDINFTNNNDKNGNTLLTTGTDGHDKSHMYPLIYDDNYPCDFDPEDEYTWFLKVYPSDDASFIDDSPFDINYTSEIGSIVFIRSDHPWGEPVNPQSLRIITYDNIFTKLFLNRNIPWNFHKPVAGDYDYDGTTYNNRTYAYVTLDTFVNNVQEYFECKAAFDITFDEKYLNPYESDLGNIVSGVHMETCSDYSENGVIKKNGFIHSIGDFDGLPSYYKMLCGKDEHRSHVELYSIRDFNNNTSVKATDKQTSAIILDSAIPPQDMSDILASLNKVIVYNFAGEREWFTVGESISKANALTSLVYIDEDNIYDDKVKGASGPHFIYHGNRYFSTDVIALDPELQYGRAMLISNDPATYENNEKTSYKKPLRTIARICDIPSDFAHLVHISGVSPTIIIDEKYIHQGASFNDADKNRLWNVLENKWCTSYESLSHALGIFDNSTNLDSSIVINDQSTYTVKENLNSHVTFVDCNVEIGTAGQGYNTNDTFTFYIGGKIVTGIVEMVNDGAVDSVSLDLDPTYEINIANLSSRISSFKTTTTNGNGSGLIVDIIVPVEIWESIQQRNTSTPYDDLFTTKFDEYGFLWFWKYNTDLNIWEKNDQLTGPKIVYNQYDNMDTMKKRSCGDVMMYNMLNIRNVVHLSETERTFNKRSSISSIPLYIPIDSILSLTGPDYQSTFYTLDRFPDEHMVPNYRVNYWRYYEYDDNTKLLPAYNQLNLSNHSVRGDALQWLLDPAIEQPLMMYYNPIMTNIVSYDKISGTVWKIAETKPMTYRDYLGDEYIDEHGKALAPIYRYNEFTPSSEYLSMESEVNQMTREQMIQYLEDNFPDSYILKFEGSEYQIPTHEIRLYIMDNWYNDPVYKCNDIYRVHEQDETVVLDDKPVGEKPSGAYMPLIETYSDVAKFNNTTFISEFTFVFKLDTVVDLTGFIIENEEKTNISLQSLILMDGHFYYYRTNQWNMIP